MKAIREFAKRSKKLFSEGCGPVCGVNTDNSSQDPLSPKNFNKEAKTYECSSSCLFSSSKESSSSSYKSSSSENDSSKSFDSKSSKESSLFPDSSSSKSSSSSQECVCLRVDKSVGPSYDSPKSRSFPTNPSNSHTSSTKVSSSDKSSSSSEDSCECSCSCEDSSSPQESSSKRLDTSKDPKQIAKNVTVLGLSKACFCEPTQPINPKIDPNKCGPYKNTEYFCYHDTTYYESQIELAEFRLPQPSALNKNYYECDDTKNMKK